MESFSVYGPQHYLFAALGGSLCIGDEDMEFLDVPIFDDDIYKMLVRFVFDILVVLAVVLFCYRRNQNNASYVFSFLLLNVMVFFICFTLKKLDLGLGMALGLFAIFGIIRYRTDAIEVKEMTYLFVVVGVAVINALSNKKTSYAELALTNGAIIGVTWLLETMVKKQTKVKPTKQSLIYDNLALLKPGQEAALYRDLAERTGFEVTDVKISKIDLQKGTASISMHYRPPNPPPPA